MVWDGGQSSKIPDSWRFFVVIFINGAIFLLWVLSVDFTKHTPNMSLCMILYKSNINSWAFAFIFEKHDNFVGERNDDCRNIINENSGGIHACEQLVEIGGVSLDDISNGYTTWLKWFHLATYDVGEARK